MTDLEIDIRQGDNTALADLFDLLHARKVLAEFGKAFGRLPENLGGLTREQEAFLDQTVAGLAQDGKVISVRLALFADMVKGKPWEPATLHAVGGTAGVGVTFLEETFSASTANPRHRLHQHPARAVLRALLPEQGSDIKGNMKSEAELRSACGFADRPTDFAELLRILDSELRLITPTDPEGRREEGEGAPGSAPPPGGTNQRFYQLTHDYLVPSLREWLTRKQRETRRGRAELRLAERTALWTAKPETRHLPSWWEWLTIRVLTKKRDWTSSQRRLMHRADRSHLLRGVALVALIGVLAFVGLLIRDHVAEQTRATQATGLVQSLLNAEATGVPDLIERLTDYRALTDPELRRLQAETDDPRQQLHLALALLPVDPSQRDALCERLLDAEPHEVGILRDALRPHEAELQPTFR